MTKTIETPLEGKLADFSPLVLKMVRHTPLEPLYNSLIQRYHYLGYRQTIGARLPGGLPAGISSSVGLIKSKKKIFIK